MYGLAYVLVPRAFASLQAELDRTLAPFKRGGDDAFAREKLTFEDATERLACLHRARFCYNVDSSLSILDGDAASSYDLRPAKLAEHMAACKLDRFEGTFAEIEPDFNTFVRSFTTFSAPDPTTLRYGRWLNPIGYWDWWELGGRFNGAIIGERRPAATEQIISSGPHSGRAMLGNIVKGFGGRANCEQAEIEANVELVETLKLASNHDEDQGLPTVLVLPAGCCADADRWFDRIGWHEIKPGTRDFLRARHDADFKTLVRAAYERFADHAAAGVAFHF